jgi:hypothetical protein
VPEQIQSIISNLRGFGVKRLAMLGGIAALVMTVITSTAMPAMMARRFVPKACKLAMMVLICSGTA